MQQDVLETVRQELVQNIDEKTRDGAQRFFKEDVKFHGVKAAQVKKIAAKYFRLIKENDKQEIFSLCEKLLETKYNEEASIAFEWSYLIQKRYEPSDFYVFERWVSNSSTTGRNATRSATTPSAASLRCIRSS